MPSIVPFWDDQYNVDNPGPYGSVLYVDNDWDTATIGGNRIPGIVTVSVAVARHLDVKTLPGASPIVTPLGYEPTHFTMTVKIWNPIQWQTLQPIMWRLLPILNRGPATKGTSAQNTFDLYHPKLASLSIASALCLKVGDLSGGQDKTLALEFLANRHGKSAVFTVEASQVNAQFTNDAAPQTVQSLSGKTTTYNTAQGPQPPPSQSGVTLTPTP